jgi:hypothetical protein
VVSLKFLERWTWVRMLALHYFFARCADARREEGKAVVAPGAYIRFLIE